ncbi:MAG TPA: AmmeMemoRadiSam system protein A, partial [Vicinamibacterales bacterium]
IDASQLDDDLKRPSGAFVTLHTAHGDLRGCIGSIQPVAPLWRAVSSNAIHAAMRDPRFESVSGVAELASLQLEISVMSPIVLVTDIEEIVVGRDGLIVSRRGRAGLLLPQVATEYGWDRETFLRHTCTKAGLPHDAWRSADTRIERFSAEVFSE